MDDKKREKITIASAQFMEQVDKDAAGGDEGDGMVIDIDSSYDGRVGVTAIGATATAINAQNKTLKPINGRQDGSGENGNDRKLRGRRADDDDILSDKELVDT